MARRGGAALVAMVLAFLAAATPPSGLATHEVARPDSRLPTERYGAAAVWDDLHLDVLLFGGTSTHSIPGDYAGEDFEDIVRFHPATGEVQVMGARLPAKLRPSSAVWAGSAAYVFGGSRSTGPFSDAIVRYDPALDRVDVMAAKLPAPVGGAPAVWTGSHALLFGGEACTYCAPTGRIVRYDPSTDHVEVMAATLSPGRRFASAVWDGGAAYVFGGSGSPGLLDDILRYDPTSDEVKTMGARLPSSREKASAVWDGQRAFLFGGQDRHFDPVRGYSDIAPIDNVVAYAPASDEVSAPLGFLRTPRALTAAASDSATAWVLGGAGQYGNPRYGDILAYGLAEHALPDHPVARMNALDPAECTHGFGRVLLDGSHSYDAAGRPVGYSWTASDPRTQVVDPAAPVSVASIPIGTGTTMHLTVTAGGLSDTTDTEGTVVDTRAPRTEATLSGTAGRTLFYASWPTVDWYVSPLTVTFRSFDECDTPAETWSAWGSEPFASGSVTTSTHDGRVTLQFYSVDGFGNPEFLQTLSHQVDTTPPETTMAVDGLAGDEGWWRSQVTLVLDVADATSGAWGSFLSVDGGPLEMRSRAVIGEGVHLLRYQGEDVAGNADPHEETLKLDATPPDMVLLRPKQHAVYASDQEVELANLIETTVVGDLTVLAVASDATSGVRSVAFLVDGEPRAVATSPPYAFVWHAGDEAVGHHTLVAEARDVAGNVARHSIVLTTVPTSAEGAQRTADSLL